MSRAWLKIAGSRAWLAVAGVAGGGSVASVCWAQDAEQVKKSIKFPADQLFQPSLPYPLVRGPRHDHAPRCLPCAINVPAGFCGMRESTKVVGGSAAAC